MSLLLTVPNHPISHYISGESLRSRSVSPVVLTGTVDIAAPPTRVTADWNRETGGRLQLQPGDVEALSLARTRMRWPGYRDCVQALSGWLRNWDLHELLCTSDAALMASRGARYHHDAAHYGGAAFCNIFLSEDQGYDLHFPHGDVRIALVRGTVVLFDTGQPHGVIARGKNCFAASDFGAGYAATQFFLTWELPVEDVRMARALQLKFDVDSATAAIGTTEQLWFNQAPVHVCPETGGWLHGLQPADRT